MCKMNFRFVIVLFTVLFSLNGQAFEADKSKTEKAGDALKYLLPASAFAATFYMDDSDGRMEFYQSFIANVVVTEGLKYLVDKPRPDGSGNDSFPSGHTSAAFNAATFIHQRYGLKYSWPAFVGATFVGWSRLDADKHEFVDVAAGAAIGILTSYYFTTPYKGFTFTPLVSSGYVGLTVSATW